MSSIVSEKSAGNLSGNHWDCFDCLKVFACILITNSHCREIYPWYFLAIGGSLGNGLFFILSGFFLAKIKDSFFVWFRKRIHRLWPTFLLFSIIQIFLIGGIQEVISAGFIQTLRMLLNKYWFVSALVLYYPFYYLLFRRKALNPWPITAVLTGLYFLLYFFCLDLSVFSVEKENLSLFKVYYYFCIFVSGGLIRRMLEGREWHLSASELKKTRYLLLSAAAFGFFIWAATYAIISLLSRGLEFQFLIHAGVTVFCISLFFFSYSYKDLCLPESRFSTVIRQVAASTLEIYMFQVTIVAYCVLLSFPLNWLLFFFLAFVGGVFIHKGISYLTDGHWRQAV